MTRDEIFAALLDYARDMAPGADGELLSLGDRTALTADLADMLAAETRSQDSDVQQARYGTPALVAEGRAPYARPDQCGAYYGGAYGPAQVCRRARHHAMDAVGHVARLESSL